MTDTGPFTANFDSLKSKTWTLRDQLLAFSGNFASNKNSVASLIEPVVIPLGYGNSIPQAHGLEGRDISQSLLNQSLESFQKAIYNFSAHYTLAEKGYYTWASVTNYYSSYFSIFSLLSLQGRAITRIRLNGVDEILCLIHPMDFRNNRYIITTQENRNPTHRLPWKKYYEIYNRYPCLKPEFDVIQLRHFVTDPIDESEERNKINYRIYEGFQEILSLQDLITFKTQYNSSISVPEIGSSADDYLKALNSLASDPGLKFFARSALRILLIRTLFEKIGASNPDFDAELKARIPIWQDTMFGHFAPPKNYFEDFVSTFLN